MILGLLTEQGFKLLPEGGSPLGSVMPCIHEVVRGEADGGISKVAVCKRLTQSDVGINKGREPFLDERVGVGGTLEWDNGEQDEYDVGVLLLHTFKNFKRYVLGIYRKTQALAGNLACNFSWNALTKITLDGLNVIGIHHRGGRWPLKQSGLIPHNAAKDSQFSTQEIANGEPITIFEPTTALENRNVPDSDGTENNILLSTQAGKGGIFGWACRMKAEIVDNGIVTEHGNVGRSDDGSILLCVGRCRILCNALIQLAQVALKRTRMNQVGGVPIGKMYA